MKETFDAISKKSSAITTKAYSTSFTLGIRFLSKKYHDPIYAIYGFVRFADEIADTFHDYNKQKLLEKFSRDTFEAIEDRISMNPILNSLQWAVNKFDIERGLIEQFLHSMKMDLYQKRYDREKFDAYVLGSAEVVGLMCLKVFVGRDTKKYSELTHPAMKLGAAFQKINFLRDMKADRKTLGRTYFPDMANDQFNDRQKRRIESEIEADFREGLKGIKELPPGTRFGVYLAYVYYYKLFRKIKRVKAEKLMNKRIRIPDPVKYALLFSTYLKHKIHRF
ncbi:MAG: phytoene/squalene synthase family protein [Bacteroidales bacterium]